jgi:predicted CoA-binding protein
VPEYLKEHGFRVIPVNPFVDEILGEKSYKSLLDIPVEAQKTVEIVQIFRPSGDVRSIVEQTVQLKRKHAVLFVVWMQLGIVSEQAAEIARSAGLLVVMDRCMMMEHERLFGG